MRRRPSKAVLSAALAAVLGLTVYLPSLGNGYTYDDYLLGLDVPQAWRWPGIKAFVTPSYFDHVPELSYRPLPSLSYYFDFLVLNRGQQQRRALVHHLTNALLHAANAALLVLLLCRLGWKRANALIAGCLFAVHPVGAEAVCAIGFREDLMVLLFCLAALLCRDAALRRPGVTAVLWSVLMGVFAAMALLSKESALLLAPAAALCDGASAAPKRQTQARWRTIAALALLSLAFLALRFGPMYRATEQGLPLWSGDRGHAFLGTCHILLNYVRLLFVPVGLNLEHMPPTGRELTLFWQAASVLFVAGCLAMGVVWWRRRRQAGFGVFWFALWVLPVCHLIPIANPMAERFLYVPLVGVAILLASTRVVAPRRRQAVLGVLLALLILAFGAITLRRVPDWQSQRTLHVAAIQWSPRCARAMTNLGRAYMDLTDPRHRESAMRLSEQEYSRAVAVDRKEHAAYFNLGHLHGLRAQMAHSRGDAEQRRAEYRRALPWLRQALVVLLRQPHFRARTLPLA